MKFAGHTGGPRVAQVRVMNMGDVEVSLSRTIPRVLIRDSEFP